MPLQLGEAGGVVGSVSSPATAASSVSCDHEALAAGQPPPPPRLRLALRYWLRWNVLSAAMSHATFRAEELVLGEVCARWCLLDAGCPGEAAELARPRSAAARTLAAAPLHARAGHHQARGARWQLSWEDLDRVDAAAAAAAWALAEELGYDPAHTPR